MANNTKTKKKRSASKKKPSAAKKKAPSKKKSSAKKNGAYTRKTAAAKKKEANALSKKNIIIIIACVLALAGVITAIVLASGAASINPKTRAGIESIDKGDDNPAWGIDVSSHNGKINWKKVSKKADFAFIRVGYRGYATGEINADKKAKANLSGANKNKVPVGVYFYSQAINEKEAIKEAKFLLKSIKDYDVTLPVVIDFEYAYSKGKITGRLYKAGLSKKEKTALINAFCDTVRKAGYTPGVYASSYIYRSHLNMKSIPDDVFIWVADYNGRVTYSGYYDIWQYSEKGKCEGVSSKKVDTNYFYTKKRL